MNETHPKVLVPHKWFYLYRDSIQLLDQFRVKSGSLLTINCVDDMFIHVSRKAVGVYFLDLFGSGAILKKNLLWRARVGQKKHLGGGFA